MMPRLGGKYQVEIEVISRPKAEYQCDEYFELELPVAPAIMVGEEIVVEGSSIAQDKVESVICRHLGFPSLSSRRKAFLAGYWENRAFPESERSKKGRLDKLFG